MHNDAVAQHPQEICRGRMLKGILGIALLLQLAGFIAPGWLVITVETVTVSVGLWFSVECIQSDCTTSSNSGSDTSVSIGFTEIKVETSVAIALCVAAFVTAFIRHMRHSIGSTLSLISGILALVASARVLYPTLTTIEALHDLEMESPIGTPYALILMAMGGFVAGVGSVVGFCFACRSTRDAGPYYAREPMTMDMPPYTDNPPQPTMTQYADGGIHQMPQPYVANVHVMPTASPAPLAYNDDAAEYYDTDKLI